MCTVKFEVAALMAVRVAQGALQGIIIPAMFSLTAKWTPRPEKNRMMTFMISGWVQMELQGSTNRRAPGCVNAAGKLRQKW